MNILVIGNGFDLAHGLPTKYTDFLKFCANYNTIKPISSRLDMNKEFVSFCDYNFWLRYFYSQIPDIDDIDENTWIDFEKEIANAIKEIEEFEHTIIDVNAVSHDSFNAAIIEAYKQYKCDKSNISFDDFIYMQLKKFTRAFEIYCLKVNNISIDKPIINCQYRNELREITSKIDLYCHQIRMTSGNVGGQDEVVRLEELRDEESKKYSHMISNIKPSDYLSLSIFDYVLSFNYTKTYEKLYGVGTTEYCYIHGKAQADGNKTNIILGIDDDLTSGEESKNFRWIRFKKYYQRIIFKTKSEYKDWLVSAQIGTDAPTDYVHIVGHSLDKTDYDVLYEIFDKQNFKIIVYYYSFKDFEEKVQRVIRLLAYKGKNGRDELIRRVHGSNWSIKFVDQYDEKEGLFIRPSD